MFWFYYSFGLVIVGLYRIPIWYDVKLIFVAWLVLPQFKGAAFLYERFVRDQIKKYGILRDTDQQHHSKSSPTGKGKKKFVQFVTTKKVSLTLAPSRPRHHFPNSQNIYFHKLFTFIWLVLMWIWVLNFTGWAWGFLKTNANRLMRGPLAFESLCFFFLCFGSFQLLLGDWSL